MRNKKFLTTLILTLSLVCSTLLGASLIGVSASTTAPSFAITDGAYIRYDAPVGISFETKILKTEYESLQAKNAQYGTVIIPSHLLGENELTVTLDAENNVISGVKSGLVINATSINTTVEDNAETTEINENLYNYYYAVVIGDKSGDTWLGLPEALYGTTLVARSYVVFDGENGREIEYAENLSTRSLAEVAKNAIVGGKLTDEQLTACHNITKIGATKLTAVNVNTALAEINSNIVLGNGDTSVIGVYVAEFGDYEIDSANYSISNGTLSFTDDYMKNLSYGTYTLKIFTDKGVYLVETNVYGESTYGDERLIGFDKSSDISMFTASDDAATKVWLPEFNGEKGVIKASYTNQWQGLKFKVNKTLAELQAMTWDTFEMHIYIEQYPNVNLSGEIYEKWPTVSKGSWNLLRYSKESIATQFGTIDSFYNALITGNTRLFAFHDSCVVYVDYIDFTTAFDKELDFSDRTSVAYVKSSGGQQWVDSYQGAKGVVLATVPVADFYGFGFKLPTEMITNVKDTKSWVYLEIKLYVPNENLVTSGATTPELYVNGWYSGGFAYDTWVTLRIPVARFGAAQLTYLSNGTEVIERNVSRGNNSTSFYIDYIKFANYEMVNDFATSDTVSQFVNNGDMINVGWEGDFQNAKGVIKVTNNVASYGDVVAIKPTSGFLYAYKNATWTSIEFVVWVEKAAGDTSTSWQFSTSSFDKGSWPGGNYGEWKTISYTKETITSSGKLDSLYNQLSNGTRVFETNSTTLQGATIYIDCIRLV